MKRNDILQTSSVILVILGVIMVILGFNSAPKVLYPPIITGIGFLVIAWVFFILKEKQ